MQLGPENRREPGAAEAETEVHAPEPWTRDGRYIRDATGAIVVRGRSPADAERIVAAVNAARAIPTDALKNGAVPVLSAPVLDAELVFEAEEAPEAEPTAGGGGPVVFERRVLARRVSERRRGERRENLVGDSP